MESVYISKEKPLRNSINFNEMSLKYRLYVIIAATGSKSSTEDILHIAPLILICYSVPRKLIPIFLLVQAHAGGVMVWETCSWD